MLHEDQFPTAYPIAIGAIEPPTFANVFMHPVTVPAKSPPISWQRAHAGVIERSAMPAATAIIRALAIECPTRAAVPRITPLVTSDIAATPHRPVLRPYFFDHRSVQWPPSKLAAAPAKRTMDDR